MNHRRLYSYLASALATMFALSLVAGCSSSGTPRSQSRGADQQASGWQIRTIASGLSNPWDVAQTPDGTLIVTERAGAIKTVRNDEVTAVKADLDDVFSKGEAGLMGLALAVDFDSSRRFYTCLATANDVRVVAWTMAADYQSATRIAQPIVSGIKHLAGGRHSGCRLLLDSEGALLISAGDATIGSAPQDRTVLNGKILRVDPITGAAWPGNPFIGSANAATKLIYTFGHRNVQGLAIQPTTGAVFSVEHGPDIDDEVNLLKPGANYGWDPDGPENSYDESVPMTDPDIDGATAAWWSSGNPTLATSGATFLSGEQWGSADGALVVACLKGSRLLLMTVGDQSITDTQSVDGLEGTHGRLRTAYLGNDGLLYITTDNGSDDEILQITPKK